MEGDEPSINDVYSEVAESLKTYMRYLFEYTGHGKEGFPDNDFPENEEYPEGFSKFFSAQEVDDYYEEQKDSGPLLTYEDIFKDMTEEEKAEAFEMLCKVSQAEAGGSDFDAIGHVASVVLNRVLSNSNDFKDQNTIAEVIFHPGAFATVPDMYNAAIPTETTKAAVQNVIDNGDTAQRTLFFCSKNEKTGKFDHEDNPNLEFVFSDSVGHRFYTYKDGNDGLPQTPSDRSSDVTVDGEKITIDGETFTNYKQPAGSQQCSLYAAAIVLSPLGYTPQDLINWGCWSLKDYGGMNFATAFNKAGVKWNDNYNPGSMGHWKDTVRRGGKAVIGVNSGVTPSVGISWTSGTHFMAVIGYKVEDGVEYVYLADPGWSSPNRNTWIRMDEWDSVIFRWFGVMY